MAHKPLRPRVLPLPGAKRSICSRQLLKPAGHQMRVPAAGGAVSTPQPPPVFASAPHFCGSDDALRAQTAGLRCEEEQHDSWLAVEPLTGITFAAAVRLQVRRLGWSTWTVA